MSNSELYQGLVEALRDVKSRTEANRICIQLRGFVTQQLYLQAFSVVDRISYYKAVYRVWCYLRENGCLGRKRRPDDYVIGNAAMDEIERVEKNLMLTLYDD